MPGLKIVAIYQAGTFQNRDAGWKTFNIDIEDPLATEVPEGWVGFGGPEDPNTYMPQLPPNRTFADVLMGIDEIVFHSIEPGYFYSINFVHDIDIDNISIGSIPQMCNGQEATIYVDYEGRRIGFCCPGCDKLFLEDPAKYLKKVDAELQARGEE